MHELSICQSLVSQLMCIADDYPDKYIAVVHLQIGPLSGVVPQLLRDAFPIASAGTAAYGAKLQITESDITVHCSQCGKDSPARSNRLICGHCGAWQTRLVSGDELLLERVEMDEAPRLVAVH